MRMASGNAAATDSSGASRATIAASCQTTNEPAIASARCTSEAVIASGGYRSRDGLTPKAPERSDDQHGERELSEAIERQRLPTIDTDAVQQRCGHGHDQH